MPARVIIEGEADGSVPRDGKGAARSTVFDGEPVTLPMAGDRLLVFKRTRGGKTYYDFVDDGSRADDRGEIMVYTYCLETGVITRGRGGLWARQELRSNSHAFNKGNQDKMAIPNQLGAAAAFIRANHERYCPATPTLDEP